MTYFNIPKMKFSLMFCLYVNCIESRGVIGPSTDRKRYRSNQNYDQDFHDPKAPSQTDIEMTNQYLDVPQPYV